MPTATLGEAANLEARRERAAFVAELAAHVLETLETNRRHAERFVERMLADHGGSAAFGGLTFYRDDVESTRPRFRLEGHHFEYVPEVYGFDGNRDTADGLLVLAACQCGSGLMAPLGRPVRELAELDGRLGEGLARTCPQCSDETDDGAALTGAAEMLWIPKAGAEARLLAALDALIGDRLASGAE